MDIPLSWLLEGPAFVQYRTRVDLLHQPEDSPDVKSARDGMIMQPEVQSLVASLEDWPGKVLSSHKSANQSFHTLNFLADLGITINDPGMTAVCEKILASASPEGPFRLGMNISEAHGGTGTATAGWALCDAPNLVYALIKMGLRDDPKVRKAIDYLVNLVQDFGWPCAVSKELGSFRGPGRKNDPCPYANLAMLKVLGSILELHEIPASSIGVQTLLKLWEHRVDQHPYIFYMGTDFSKLKAPLIWYDILHVADVLSHFPRVMKERAYQDMVSVIRSKATVDGRFIPESVYMPYKDWDFGQKKEPSRWLTFLACRIFSRSEK
jgi:hypothetical protein